MFTNYKHTELLITARLQNDKQPKVVVTYAYLPHLFNKNS